MTENDLALQMTAQVVASETARRFNSHGLSEEEIRAACEECKAVAKLIMVEFYSVLDKEIPRLPKSAKVNTKKRTISSKG